MPDYSTYAMVKDGVASRTPLPAELWGIPPEGLLDLEWLPESYGVRGCQWWPVEDQSTPLGKYQSYGDETLTLDVPRTVVIAHRPVRDWPPEEILAYKASIQRHITHWALRRRLTQAERVAFEFASLDNPSADPADRLAAAELRVMDRDMGAARHIDLNLVEFQAGIHELEARGVIGVGRADQIIWGDIEEHEVP